MRDSRKYRIRAAHKCMDVPVNRLHQKGSAVMLVKILAYSALLLSSTNPLQAKGAVRAAYSWGKPGVFRSDYDADAVSCSLRSAARDVAADKESKSCVQGFEALERENNMPPMARTIDDEGLIAQSNRNVLLRRMYRPDREVDALQSKLQGETEECLISRGYTRFLLSHDQSRKLKAFRIGSLERRDFLYSLGSDAAIVVAQRAKAGDH